MEFLSGNEKWGADGTFSVVPLLFDQLWTIFGRLDHTYVPAVYVLMNRRTEESYRFVIERLKEMKPYMAPTHISLDFERAEWNAFRVIFILKENEILITF